MESKISPLFAPEIDDLKSRFERASLLSRRHGGPGMERSPDDVAELDRLLAIPLAIDRGDEATLQDLGTALGFALGAVEPRLVWVMVEDELGRDPGMVFRGSDALLFPLTMFSKRIERGEEFSARSIFYSVLRVLSEQGEEGKEE